MLKKLSAWCCSSGSSPAFGGGGRLSREIQGRDRGHPRLGRRGGRPDTGDGADCREREPEHRPRGAASRPALDDRRSQGRREGDGSIKVRGRGLLLAGGNGIGGNAGQSVRATLICEASAPFTLRNTDPVVPLELNGDFRIDGVLDPLPPAVCDSPVLLIRNPNGAWFAAGIVKRIATTTERATLKNSGGSPATAGCRPPSPSPGRYRRSSRRARAGGIRRRPRSSPSHGSPRRRGRDSPRRLSAR